LSNINLKECSFVLVNKTLYISGGTNNNKNNLILYKLEPLSNINDQSSLIYVNDLNKHWIKHTSFYKNEFIYLVGGENDLSVQRYHLDKNKLESLPKLNKPRERCGCLIINDSFLYVFFGKKNLQDKIKSFDTFEFLNLNDNDSLNSNTMTEMSVENLKNNLYNFGFVQYQTNIFLCGGEESRNIYCSDYSDIKFNLIKKKLPKSISFLHNDFTKIDNKFINFTYENQKVTVYSIDQDYFKI
jgi:hypothetical protein